MKTRFFAEVVLLLLEDIWGEQLAREETRALEMLKLRHVSTPF